MEVVIISKSQSYVEHTTKD